MLTTRIQYVHWLTRVSILSKIKGSPSNNHSQVNIAIHIACVPVILFCALQHLTLPIFSLPHALTLPFHYPLESLLPFDLSTLVAATYTTLYILMEPIAGAFVGTIVLLCAYLAHAATAHFGAYPAATAAALLETAAWVAQFVGHGVYEGRAPALLDNLVQAFFLAPLFVGLEVLFRAGYKPRLKQRIDRAIARAVVADRHGKADKARQQKKAEKDS